MGKSKHLTTEEIAQLFNLPLVTIQRWEHQGKIPYKISSHIKSYNRKEILKWAKDHDLTINEESGENETSPGQILYNAVEQSGIYYDIPGNNIVEVFENALNALPFLKKANRKMILNEMLDREELASTALGRGIAIPHTRERFRIGSDQIYIPVLFLENDIEFNAIDGEKVFVLYMIFTENTRDHLMVLSRISQALKDKKMLDILHEKNKNQNLLSHILEIEKKFHT
jgi:PTS system nitrogen regulatory IIA component